MGGLAMADAVIVDGRWLIIGIVACVPLLAWGVYDIVMLAKEAKRERRWLESREKQDKMDKKDDRENK